MRVLVVSAWEPWRGGDGACLVLHAHLRELAPRHDVELLAAGAPVLRTELPGGDGTVPPGVAGGWYGTALPAAVDGLLRRVRRGEEPAHVGYVARPALLRDLRRAVVERRPDVIHLFGWGTAALQPHLDGVPAVHDAVDPWAANLLNRSTGPAHGLLDRGETRRVAEHERRWYPRLSAVVVRTEEDAEELRQQVPGARTTVVPNGVDLGPDPAPPSGAVLAFLGAYDARSNVEAAVDLVTQVLPRVRQVRPDARVLLIGRDPPAELRALAGAHVELTGAVPDVRPHLERATVVVAPLKSGRGVKNKVLEAMAAGRPVVATAQALHGIGPSEGVREAETPAAQAEAALEWLTSGAAEAGAANRDRVSRQHTWARSAAVLEGLWQAASCSSTS